MHVTVHTARHQSEESHRKAPDPESAEAVKLSRRTFLSSGIGAAVAAISTNRFASASESRDVRVALVTGDYACRIDAARVIEELGMTVELLPRSAVADLLAGRYSLLWMVATSYPEPMELSGLELATIEKFLTAGKGVLVEFPSNFPDASPAGGIRKGDVARLFVVDAAPFADSLPSGAILDPNDAVCLPLQVTPHARAIIQLGKIAGVERMDPKIQPKNLLPGVLLGERGGGRFAVAATSISEFTRRQYAPQGHWERLLRDLALMLLPEGDRKRVLEKYIPLRVHTEPRRWAAPAVAVRLVAETTSGVTLSLAGQPQTVWRETGPGRFEAEVKSSSLGEHQFQLRAARGQAVRSVSIKFQVDERKAAYRRALDNNLSWFEKSGVLLRPDGSLGVAEWISGPDIEGNRIPFGKRQGFSPERADCVFESALAFWLYGKVAASERYQTTGRNMLFNIMDFQRLSVRDQFYGLWYTRGREGPVFQDDEAWAIMGSLGGYRYTREPMFMHRGRMAADAAATVFASGAPKAAEAADPAHPRPSDRGQMIAAWLYMYGITGDRVFLDQGLSALRELVKSFPESSASVPSHTSESARFLLPLALACAYSEDLAFSTALREQAQYLASRMVSCGAIQEQGVYTGSKVQGGDLSLIHDSSEPISDQLYTTSFAAMNLWIAYKATGDAFYLENFYRVTDFLVRIQIESPDPTINGGWMRGFDYSLWEYYGSNADQSWTAYCLETGWCNAIIDLALGLYLVDDSFYEARTPLPAESV
jgi:hypothetical protein